MALLSVVSFVVISLIGGGLLWYTERDRMVNNYQPYTQEVRVVYSDRAAVNDPYYEKQETHTFVKSVQYEGERLLIHGSQPFLQCV